MCQGLELPGYLTMSDQQTTPRHPSPAVRVFLALTLTCACAACAAAACGGTDSSSTAADANRSRVHRGAPLAQCRGSAARDTCAYEILPDVADFHDADYLEFGWGDRDYYNFALLLKVVVR
jgi:hypothetical protein